MRTDGVSRRNTTWRICARLAAGLGATTVLIRAVWRRLTAALSDSGDYAVTVNTTAPPMRLDDRASDKSQPNSDDILDHPTAGSTAVPPPHDQHGWDSTDREEDPEKSASHALQS
jgi:hypothetical protein